MTALVSRERVGGTVACGRRDSRWLAQRPDAEASLLASVLVIGMVAGMAIGIGPVVVASSFATLAVAVAAPYVGLIVLAFMAPLVAPPVLPTPGFMVILVGAIVLGCIYRLPIDRPRFAP